MLLTELTAVRMSDSDVTRLRHAYVTHVDHTRHAYLDYCNGLQNAIFMCRRLRTCAPSFAVHVQVMNDTGRSLDLPFLCPSVFLSATRRKNGG